VTKLDGRLENNHRCNSLIQTTNDFTARDGKEVLLTISIYQVFSSEVSLFDFLFVAAVVVSFLGFLPSSYFFEVYIFILEF